MLIQSLSHATLFFYFNDDDIDQRPTLWFTYTGWPKLTTPVYIFDCNKWMHLQNVMIFGTHKLHKAANKKVWWTLAYNFMSTLARQKAFQSWIHSLHHSSFSYSYFLHCHLKLDLKFSVCALITLGQVGVSSRNFSRRRIARQGW